MQTEQKTIEVVIQAEDGGASLLWDHAGNLHVADDPEALGRWTLELAASSSTPAVEFGKPTGRWTELASRWLDQQGVPRDVAEDATAVHLVVQLRFAQTEDGPSLVTAVVNPQKGRARLARSVAELGERLDALARDDDQPRVPGGAPPDAFGALLARGAACLGEAF